MTEPVLPAPTGARRFNRFRISRRKRFLMQTAAFFGFFALYGLYSVAPNPFASAKSALSADGHGMSPAVSPMRQLLAQANGTCVAPADYTGPHTCTKTGGEVSFVGLLAGHCCCEGEGQLQTCCTSFDAWYGVIVYFFVVAYTFLGLAIICDDYFCESLEAISEALKLSDDVAGATFMAAGSSAPELFTAIVTTLIIEGSEGLGTIVGSAIFNIMIIVGVTAICAGQVLEIWWYPLSRDCVVYVISIVLMVVVVQDNEVQWYESLVMVVCYGGYIALMVYNERITNWIESRSAKVEPSAKAMANLENTTPFSKLSNNQRPSNNDISAAASALAKAASGSNNTTPSPFPNTHSGKLAPLSRTPSEDGTKTAPAPAAASDVESGGATSSPAAKKTPAKKPEHKRGMNPLLKPMNRASVDHKTAESRKKTRAALQLGTLMKVHSAKSMFLKKIRAKRAAAAAAAAAGGAASPASTGSASGSGMNLAAMMAKKEGTTGGSTNSLLGALAAKKEEDKKQEEEEDDEGLADKILWFLSLPYVGAFTVTVPDCREDKWKSWYMLTFTMSILWIGILSFFMVDFAGRAGCVLQVPGIVMGLVVIAAGTSVPDALSSILVAKNGQGDMAVANVLGSNVFNIFLGLGLPWFVKSCTQSMQHVQLADDGIVIPTIILLLYVVFFIGVIASRKWKLDKTVGYVFILGHFVFLAWNLLTMLDDPVINLRG